MANAYFFRTIKCFAFKLAIVASLFLASFSEAGDCRLCISCAQSGLYSIEVGHELHKGDWGPYNAYPENCLGDTLFAKPDEVHLCCSPPTPSCFLCQSCGGDYPHEMGRRLNVGDWGQWVARQVQKTYISEPNRASIELAVAND